MSPEELQGGRVMSVKGVGGLRGATKDNIEQRLPNDRGRRRVDWVDQRCGRAEEDRAARVGAEVPRAGAAGRDRIRLRKVRARRVGGRGVAGGRARADVYRARLLGE